MEVLCPEDCCGLIWAVELLCILYIDALEVFPFFVYLRLKLYFCILFYSFQRMALCKIFCFVFGQRDKTTQMDRASDFSGA